MIRIISDGSADLPLHLVQELDIRIVPLTVRFGEETMPPNTDARTFYAKMRASGQLPKTASPSPHDFMDAYRKAGSESDILVLPISSNISSTFQNAQLAKEMLLEEGGHRGRIEVLDSKSASAGLGLLGYRAAKLAAGGINYNELLQRMRTYIANSNLFVCLDSLENVIKGGRLDRARGAVASLLNIKLLMKASEEGTLEVVEKVRGTQQAVKRLIDKVGEVKHDFEQAVLAIAHSNCEERAKAVVSDILAIHPFREVLFADMGPVIGTYAGEGGILVSY